MRDIYSKLTDKIVASLEAGVTPWFQPWASQWGDRKISRPLRANGQPYRGINVIQLWLTAEFAGYSNPYWMTFRQAKALGAHVRKGEHGTEVVFVNHQMVQKDTEDKHSVWRTGTHTVFNGDQIDGLPAKYHADVVLNTKPRIEAVEAFFNHLNMTLRHGGGRAFYSPSDDRVQMPNFEDFTAPADYYVTLGHESVHWTSHTTRLDRKFDQQRWGDEGYAMEELVAELGSVFIAADLGITAQPRPDHASYIANWLSVLKNDKRAIFTAASHADRAITYLHKQQPGYVEPAADTE